MAIRVAIRHQTSYQYDRLVNLSPHTFRLRPAAHCRTPMLSYSLKVKPEEHFINWQQDPFGNFLARVVFPEKTKLLQEAEARGATVLNGMKMLVLQAEESWRIWNESSL